MRSPVLIVSPQIDASGGVGTHVAALLPALKERGVEVRVLAGQVGDAGSRYGAAVIAGLHAPLAPPVIEQLLSTASDIAPSLVHSHLPLSVDVVQRLEGIAPVLQSVHNYQTCTTGLRYLGNGTPCRKAHGPACVPMMAIRNCGHRRFPPRATMGYPSVRPHIEGLRRASGVIAYSQYVKRDLARHDICATLMPLFYPGVHAGVPSSPGAETTPPRILFVGRTVPYKGVNVLLRAVAPLDVEVDICGAGFASPSLKRLLTRLKPLARVHFHGHVEGAPLARLYRQSTIVAVPSIWPEPFGLVGLEAMAFARPVVASRTGGIPEWLSEGVNGLLASPGSVTDLRDAIEVLLRDPAGATQMGLRGRELLDARFTLRAHIDQLTALYASMAHR